MGLPIAVDNGPIRYLSRIGNEKGPYWRLANPPRFLYFKLRGYRYGDTPGKDTQ
ncbi:MAG: hypothetical protein ABSF45_29395 [Terriglobia bacterium]|jgi:hypothetical protein